MSHDGAHCLLREAWLRIAEYLCVILIFLQRVTGNAFGHRQTSAGQERVTKPLRTSAWEAIGVRAIFCHGEGGGETIYPKNTCELPNFLQNRRKETRAIRCNNIGRTGIRKRFDTVFRVNTCTCQVWVVLDKDENLSWSGLQWHWSWHSNDMTPLPIIQILYITYSAYSNISQNRSRELFLPIVASIFVKLKRNLEQRYREILGWSFRN